MTRWSQDSERQRQARGKLLAVPHGLLEALADAQDGDFGALMMGVK